MGGSGSGRYGWGGGKRTTESQHRIDIRWMKRQGYLRAGTMGNLIWSNRGEQTGLITYSIVEEGMVLNYRYRINGGEWQPVEQRIIFDRTPCNYGGYRTWFRCPRCGKRVALLYGAGKLFLCRHCYDLAYGSQQEGQLDRLMRKARKIRHRLGAEDDLTMPIWQKPKGMHEKTYLRLRSEANSASGLSSKLMIQRFGTDFDI
jgi:hypothetical protein